MGRYRWLGCLVAVLWMMAFPFSQAVGAGGDSGGASVSGAAFLWYDGPRRRIFRLAAGEVALYTPRPLTKQDWLRVLPRALPEFPKAVLTRAFGSWAQVRLPKPLPPERIKELLGRSADRISIVPVFYSAKETHAPFILLPEMIVHFQHSLPYAEVRQWGEKHGLKLLKQLSLDNAFLFSCNGLECLHQSRQIYESEAGVRYAYPNWIRPRHPRQFLNQFSADLQLQLAASANPAIQGEPLELRMTVWNQGPAVANGIHLVNPVPKQAKLSKVTTSGGSCFSGSVIRCTFGSLPKGETLTVVVTLIPIAPGTLVDTAEVTAFTQDPDPNNNSASIALSVTAGNSETWNDPLYGNQWYFQNTGQGGGVPGADVDIVPAWEQGLTGKGLQVAIVDDGLEIDHEDLAANAADTLHHDFVDGDDNPTAGSHGTSVAGIAAADGNNGTGIVGTAPDAELIGLRLLGATSDTNEAAALDYRPDIVDLSNNSWGPPDSGQLLSGPGPLTEAAIADGATNGRDGKGIIYCWAGGNGGDNDNSNYDGYANLRYTIAVAASNNQGKRAPYSEKGANILVNAPSSGGTLAITTTDRSGIIGFDRGNYTDSFGGTSAAAPLACGTIALLLEANPDLSWRDVQYILATTAFQNDPQDPDWTVNSAGYHVSHKYGFGRIDIAAAIAAARNWVPLGEEVSVSGGATPNLPIPDNDATGVSSTIDIAEDIQIESVEVIFSADDHPYWGDLDIRLISPSGTVSVLAERHHSGKDAAYYSNWRFTSMRHLGESSKGVWTLWVRDLASGDTGTFQSWQLRIYGFRAGNSPPGPMADLQVSLTDVPDPVGVGDHLVYTATITNLGLDAADRVVASLTLTPQLELAGLTASQGSCGDSSCVLGMLAPGDQAEITVTTIPHNEGEVSANVFAESDTPDPDPSNNSASETTTVTAAAQTRHLLKVDVFGQGGVISDPAGIDCPSDCTETYPENTLVILTAEPPVGGGVLWFGACTGTQATCEVTMTATKRVVAFFH